MANNSDCEQSCTIKPCPVCAKPMTLRKTSALVGSGYRKWFFFLYCNQCGYGPNSAFDTIDDAVTHWNQSALMASKLTQPQTCLNNGYRNTFFQ